MKSYGVRKKRSRAKGVVCPRCRHDKPESEFGTDSRRPSGLRTYCRTCRRIYDATYAASDACKAMRKRSKESRLEYDRRRNKTPERRAAQIAATRAYRATPRGSVMASLTAFRGRLRRATDPVKADRLRWRIAQCEAEIARMDTRKRDRQEQEEAA